MFFGGVEEKFSRFIENPKTKQEIFKKTPSRTLWVRAVCFHIKENSNQPMKDAKFGTRVKATT